MQVFTDLNKVDFKKCVATIGIFDGVHLAHQMLLQRLRNEANKSHSQSVVITFSPHPRKVLQPEIDLKLLSTQSEKYQLLKQTGCVDAIIEINFTTAFSTISANEFCLEILQKKLHVSTLILGYDHHFGNKREGNIRYFDSHRFDFNVIEIEKQMIDNLAINSSTIRNELLLGKLKNANLLLGRNYTFSGIVVQGNKLGRTIGFPTANIMPTETSKLIPQNGVYAVKIQIETFDNQTFNGMLNIGFRPTVDGSKLTIEAHVFDFDADIYSKNISIELVEKIREEIKFDSIASLKNQLQKDKNAIIDLIS